MARGHGEVLFRHFRGILAAKDAALSDHELLEWLATGRQEAAFEILLARHGPMVLRVCQGVLRDAHLAEDAFQATFLVLFRKVAAIRKQTSVGSWLYKVAYRIAVRARSVSVRRRRRESQVAARAQVDPLDEATWRELRAIFAEELQRLPEKYRAPVVLCCLQGWARDEAAQQLGWSFGQLKARLERGRELLRVRLLRRGIAPTLVLGAALFPEDTAQATVPSALADATHRIARATLWGRALNDAVVSPQVHSLTQGALRAMTISKITMMAAVLALVGILGSGTATMARQLWTARQPDGQRVEAPFTQSGDAAPKPATQPGTGLDRQGDPLPAGARARLGTLRFRHMHTISSLTYSANGQYLLSGSWDNTVRLWSAITGQELRRFKPESEGFSSVAISPDGSTIAAGNMRRTLYLWEAATGREICRVEKLENTVFGLRFSPDGRILAGVSGNAVRLWNATGEELMRVTKLKPDLRPFVFSADLKTFVAGLPDRSIQCLDLSTGAEKEKFPTQQADLSCLAISPDGSVIATGGGNKDRSVHLWRRKDGAELFRRGSLPGWVDSLALSPDGKSLAVGESSGAIHVYETDTAKERCQCSLRQGSWVRALTFSPDGRTLAAGGTDEHSVRFFDAATGREQQPFTGHQNEIVAAIPALDGLTMLSAGKDGVVYQWDPRSGTASRHWRANNSGITAMALVPNTATVILASGSLLRLCDLMTGKEIRRYVGHGGGIDAIACSPDGTLLASGGWADHTIRLWDIATGQERQRIPLPMPRGHNYGDVPLVFAAKGKILISGSADRGNPVFYYWDTTTGKQLRQIDCQVSHLALSPDGTLLASAGWDRHVRIWDVATAKEVHRFPGEGATLAFSPDGHMLAHGGTDGVIHLSEVVSGQDRQTFIGHLPGGDEKGTFASGVARLAFTPDGSTLISGGGDTTLLLWSLTDSGPEVRAAPSYEELWSALAGDGKQGFRAMKTLVKAGPEAVAFLNGKLQPAQMQDPQTFNRWIAELDSDQFSVRSGARRAAESLNETALPILRQALTSQLSLEVRRDLEQALQSLEGPPSGARLRALRAVEVLERIASPQARDVLHRLADGTPNARLTKAAKGSLESLAH
jgi:RNA polymerase sigma factor (sigma-70 family)